MADYFSVAEEIGAAVCRVYREGLNKATRVIVSAKDFWAMAKELNAPLKEDAFMLHTPAGTVEVSIGRLQESGLAVVLWDGGALACDLLVAQRAAALQRIREDLDALPSCEP